MNEAVPNGPLLERTEELRRIDAALDGARGGRGTFVVIEGPPGIGKTALLAAARTAAADRGMKVLRSRGTDLEREFAFGVVRQLFERALAEASEAERADLLQGAAGVAAGFLRLPGAPPVDELESAGVDSAFAIVHGLYWLCANLAAVDPVCLVIDDAHCADTPSLRYLAFLLPRLEELCVALIAATRPLEGGTDADLLAALTTDPAADLIQLPPLTRAAVAELVASRFAAVPDAAFVDACMRATRGTPFLLRVLVDALREGGIAPNAEAAPHVERIGARTVGRSIRLRLRRLPAHAGRLARALAILEQDDFAQAARLAGLEEGEAVDAAELLQAAGVLESARPLAFSHPIIRSGIYSELPASDRARGHRRAAELLGEHAGAEARVAEHLLASEPAGDAWVVERLVAAASAARKQGAPESEAVFLRRVLAEPPPPAERSALLLDLGIAEASVGQPDWREHLQAAVDTAPTVAAAAEAALVLGHALSAALRFSDAVEVLDRAAVALDGRESELGLRLEAAAVIAELNAVTGPSASVRRETLRNRAVEGPAPPPELLAAAAFISVLANEAADVGAELARRALVAGERAARSAGGSWFSFTGWFSQATFALLWAERYEQLRALLDASIAQARATGDSMRLAMGLANRGWLAAQRGDLYAAEGDTGTALAATDLPAPPMYRVMNAALLIETLVDEGELDGAERVLMPLDSEAERSSLIGVMLRFARGRLRVEQRRVTEGLGDLLAVGETLGRALVTCPAAMHWRSEAALAHLALGDRAAAERLADEEVALARAFGAPRALAVAKRAAGVVAGGERGEVLLREAVDAFGRANAGLERARALVELGALLRRRNRRTEARELLRDALDAAHRLGARRLADRAETELRATGARPRRAVLTGVDSLTASERRVAALAGEGLTNREIAQRLFITTRTVEGHLTSVFRKLDVDSRDALPGALADGAPVPA